jgi:DNA-binding CsgD family transcriptional regulator
MHLDALWAAMWAGHLGRPGGVPAAADAARAAPPGPEPPRAVDVLLDAFVLRLTQGYEAAAPLLARALELSLALDVTDDEADRWRWLAGGRASALVALELWDDDSWHALAAVQARVARDAGALVHLQYALNFLAAAHLFSGELTTAARLVDEDRLIAEVTGNPPVGYAAIALAAWRGQEAQGSELIEATSRAATARGLGRMVSFAAYASSVLDNGLGRYDQARDAARRAFERDQLGFGPFVVPELAEAAARTGDLALARAALQWLSERTQLVPSEWALGIEGRVRALLSEGAAAERCHRESIERLGRTRVRVQLARAHLLYGEWLRRQRRRLDARSQLGTAYDLLAAMGTEAFAERARRELEATGETARRRTVQPRDALTAQEALVARLARDGLSNPEIGTRLFISASTVKYHLGKVFAKLDITSRAQLDRALARDPAWTRPK